VPVRGRDHRKADHAVDDLFVDRWSPRAMSGEPLSQAELSVLFEAARWAPSAGNTHPWRILYAHRDTEQWPLFFDLLVERNQVWCRNAAASCSSSRATNGRTVVLVTQLRHRRRVGEPPLQGAQETRRSRHGRLRLRAQKTTEHP
jgi:nitroreductase